MTLAAASITAPLAAQEPDWVAANKATLANLQTMIRLNTVNPPGNEMQVARFLEFGTRMIYGAILRVAR